MNKRVVQTTWATSYRGVKETLTQQWHFQAEWQSAEIRRLQFERYHGDHWRMRSVAGLMMQMLQVLQPANDTLSSWFCSVSHNYHELPQIKRSRDHATSSVTALFPPPVQRCGTVCLNSFGNQTSPLDNLNDRSKRLCLVSRVAAPCAWTLRAPTRNLLAYLLTYLQTFILHCMLKQNSFHELNSTPIIVYFLSSTRYY